MSEKHDLLHATGSAKAVKPPQCTAEIARRYMRKEKFDKRGSITAPPDVGNGDRRLLAWCLVDERLGLSAPTSQRTEPILRHAAYRWLVSSCRSRDSMMAYAGRLQVWIAATGKRSFSMQVNTSADDVSSFLFALEAEGKAPRTIVHHRDVLRSWFHWLYDRDYIHRTPITRDLLRSWRVDHQAVRKANGRRQSLSLAEAQKVARWCLTTATPEAGLSVLLQMVGGLRSDEVARLERRHLVEREDIVTLTVVGKGNKSRQIVLEQPVVAAWHRYLRRRRRQGERGPLLVRPGGGHYDRRAVQRWAKQAAAVAGRPVDISSHDLRKTAITLLVEAGADLASARDVAGHSDLRLTERCYVTRKPALDVVTGVGATDAGQPKQVNPTQPQPTRAKSREGDSRAIDALRSDTPLSPECGLGQPTSLPPRPAGPTPPPIPGEGGALVNPEALPARKNPKMPQGHAPATGVVLSDAGGVAW